MVFIRKASLSLSTNAIVVLILAITMLGLALGFIKTMFGKTSAQVEAIVNKEVDPVPAGPEKTLTLSRTTLVLSPSDTTALKFSVYKGNVITTEPSLVGYWSFDEGSVNVANDLSGKGNTGTFVGSLIYVVGKNGRALEFPGASNNYVNILVDTPTAKGLNLKMSGKPFTLSAWIYPIDTANRDIIRKTVDGSHLGFGLFFSNNNLRPVSLYRGATQPDAISPNSLSINNWYHIAQVVDGSNNIIYVDGVNKATTSTSYLTFDDESDLQIGKIMGLGDFKGRIDEVQIYNRALSSDEIKNIAQGNLIAVNKGCIADTNTDISKPLKIISQVSKNIANGESETSSLVIKAHNSPVDTVCEICATPLGGGGCVDVRVIVK